MANTKIQQRHVGPSPRLTRKLESIQDLSKPNQARLTPDPQTKLRMNSLERLLRLTKPAARVAKEPKTEYQEHLQMAKALSKSLVAAPARAAAGTATANQAPESEEVRKKTRDTGRAMRFRRCACRPV